MREADRTLDEVVKAVAVHFGISPDHVLSGRERPKARYVAKYLALLVTRRSLGHVGAYFGGVSGKNVLVAARKVEHDMDKDTKFAAEVMALKDLLVTRS
jgi:chromosomal replication initiation ATPase DnaA